MEVAQSNSKLLPLITLIYFLLLKHIQCGNEQKYQS